MAKSFRATLTDLLSALNKGPVPACAEPWLDAAAELGPLNPPQGPLTHDVLVPGTALGLNVFAHPRIAEIATAWAHRWLSAEAATRAAAVLSLERTTWHGGFQSSASNLKLKLYATTQVPRVLAALSAHAPHAPEAVGLDVTPEGITRVRTYHAPDDSLLEGWPAEPWPQMRGPGISHRLITVLGDEKRTLNTIFLPSAPLSSLPGSEALVTGFKLAPAAHELDVYRDGRRETDLLVTLMR
jgi:hypothetical protein